MGLWQDLQQGKKPFKPKLSRKSVGLRLALSLPFLVFGSYLIYRTAEARVHLERNANGSVSARVYRRFWGIPFAGHGLQNITAARVEQETRQVEKHKFGGGSRNFQSTDTRWVSRIVLIGGADGSGELPVSEFRFDSEQVNNDTLKELNQFLQTDHEPHLTRTIPFEESHLLPGFAMVFLFGLGGFIFISLPIDMLIWWIQKRYRVRQARSSSTP